ncbi:MAG TPA: extracellular solute-binding protein [Catenuloplanes sp.]|jgi:multiple sugar transport system substrate-binding protein
MKRSIAMPIGLAVVLALGVSACGSDDASEGTAGKSTTLTLGGWSLATTPEFQKLADAFRAENPDITVQVKEYDATNYDTQMTADLAAGSAPDIYVMKNLRNFHTYQSGGALQDVSDVAAKYDANTKGLNFYQVDGKAYAIPYRQDSWYLYYNKDLFKKAQVAEPDGSWTWDDYAAAAKKLTTGLKGSGAGAMGTYQHVWQSTVQGFALAQTPGADLLKGDFSYMTPYYQRSLDLQESGAQATFGTATTNTLTYQSQFGTQKAAMMPMGSWYVATLLAQQAKGDAAKFEWGIAPAPQRDKSTTSNPVTFGDPTGMGINPKVSGAKRDAAKKFLGFIGGEKSATAMAGIGITPAYASTTVTDAYFALKGIPTDKLSKFAFATHDTKPENPVSKHTTALQNLLKETHSSIMSKSVPAEKGITDAQGRAKSQVLNK